VNFKQRPQKRVMAKFWSIRRAAGRLLKVISKSILTAKGLSTKLRCIIYFYHQPHRQRFRATEPLTRC